MPMHPNTMKNALSAYTSPKLKEKPNRKAVRRSGLTDGYAHVSRQPYGCASILPVELLERVGEPPKGLDG
jgi:hypothetical protein